MVGGGWPAAPSRCSQEGAALRLFGSTSSAPHPGTSWAQAAPWHQQLPFLSLCTDVFQGETTNVKKKGSFYNYEKHFNICKCENLLCFHKAPNPFLSPRNQSLGCWQNPWSHLWHAWRMTWARRHWTSSTWWADLLFTGPRRCRGVINWVFILLAGVTIHGGPSSQWGTRKHLWKLYHPEGSVVPGVTGWDPRSGRQPGVEKRQCWQCWARLAAAAGLCLQLCTLTQDGQTPAEVRNGFLREQLYSKVMCNYISSRHV